MASSTFRIHHEIQEIPKQTAIIITPADVKQCLDEYDRIKTPSCTHPMSDAIQNLRKFHKTLTSPQLTDAQLWNLIIYIRNINSDSPNTLKASEELRKKIAPLSKFFDIKRLLLRTENHRDKVASQILIAYEVFQPFVKNPHLIAHLESIITYYMNHKHFSYYFGSELKDKLLGIMHKFPHAIKIISESMGAKTFNEKAFTLDYCERISDIRFLIPVCNAFSKLEDWQKTIYNNSRCLNKDYKSYIYSNQTVSFILQHAEQADTIAEIMIALHVGKIGKEMQDKASLHIWSIGDNKEENVAQQLKSLLGAFQSLQANKLLNEANAEFIVTLCDPQYRPHADKMAQAAVNFHKLGKFNSAMFTLIKSNPTNAHYISDVLSLLETARLTDLVNNDVYLKLGLITSQVVEIITQLNAAKPCLLSRDNATMLLSTLSHANEILAKLASPLTQDTFNKAIQELQEENQEGFQPGMKFNP